MNFLKFSFGIINISHIKKVLTNENNYKIFLNNNKFFGFNTPIMGYITSENDVVELNKKGDENDCKILEDWINKL
jgi:hypothetical protein